MKIQLYIWNKHGSEESCKRVGGDPRIFQETSCRISMTMKRGKDLVEDYGGKDS